jgi:hypothetical protein
MTNTQDLTTATVETIRHHTGNEVDDFYHPYCPVCRWHGAYRNNHAGAGNAHERALQDVAEHNAQPYHRATVAAAAGPDIADLYDGMPFPT